MCQVNRVFLVARLRTHGLRWALGRHPDLPAFRPRPVVGLVIPDWELAYPFHMTRTPNGELECRFSLLDLRVAVLECPVSLLELRSSVLEYPFLSSSIRSPALECLFFTLHTRSRNSSSIARATGARRAPENSSLTPQRNAGGRVD